ncbi:hypothetical protein ES708_24995 [subsurface metagenome]
MGAREIGEGRRDRDCPKAQDDPFANVARGGAPVAEGFGAEVAVEEGLRQKSGS